MASSAQPLRGGPDAEPAHRHEIAAPKAGFDRLFP
jgi:hypothetical protein